MNKHEKIVLVTHNDLDGVGCQILLKRIFPDYDIKVFNCNYDKVDSIVKKLIQSGEHYDRLLITDISVRDKEVIDMIDKQTCFVTVALLDHHDTVEYLNQFNWATVKKVDETGKKVCGTSLLLDYIEKVMHTDIWQNIRYFTELVRLWDTWDWVEHKDEFEGMLPKKLNTLLHIYGIEKFAYIMYSRLYVGCTEELLDETDELILSIKQEEINNYINQKESTMKKVIVDDHRVGVIFGEMYISETGNELSNRHPELDYIAILNGNVISLRTSKNDIHLGEIAKKYGGGGHQQAAGFSMPSDKVDELLWLYFEHKVDFLE